eukprot:1125660-Amorphochlora_amoeboformis.AAC.1
MGGPGGGGGWGFPEEGGFIRLDRQINFLNFRRAVIPDTKLRCLRLFVLMYIKCVFFTFLKCVRERCEGERKKQKESSNTKRKGAMEERERERILNRGSRETCGGSQKLHMCT